MSSGALFYIILDEFKQIEKNFDWEYGKVYKIKEIYDFSSQSFIYKEQWNNYLGIENNDPLLFDRKEWIYFNTTIMDINSNIAELQECYKMGTDGIVYDNQSCKIYNICEFKNDTYYPVNDYVFHSNTPNNKSTTKITYFKPEYGVLVYPKSHVFHGTKTYDPNSFHTSIYPELNSSLHQVYEYIKNKDYITYTLSLYRGKRNIQHTINVDDNIIFRIKRSLRFRDVFNSYNLNQYNDISFHILNKDDETIKSYTLNDITVNENVLLQSNQRLKVVNNATTSITIQLHKYLFQEKISKNDILITKEKMKKKKDPPYGSEIQDGKILNDALAEIYEKDDYIDIFDTTTGIETELKEVKKEKKRFEKEVIKEFLKDQVSDTELGLKVVKGKFLGKSTSNEEKQYVIPKTNKIKKGQMKEYKNLYVPIDDDNPTMYYGPETFEYNSIEYEDAIITIEMDKDEEYTYNGKIIKNAGKINDLYDSEDDEIKLYFKEKVNTNVGDIPFLFFKDVNGENPISFEECKILPEMKYRLQNIDTNDSLSKRMKLSDRKNDENKPDEPKTHIDGFNFNGSGLVKDSVVYFKKRREDEPIYIFDSNDNTNTFTFPQYDEQTDNIELFIKKEEGYTMEIKQNNENIVFEIGSVTITVIGVITPIEMSNNEVKTQLETGDLSNVQIDGFDISNISFGVDPKNIHFLNSTIQGMDVSGIDLSGLTFDNSTNITGVSGEPTNIALGYSIVDGIFYNRLIFEKIDISYTHYDVKIERTIWRVNNIETPTINLKLNVSYNTDFSGSIDNSFDIFYSISDLSDTRFPFGGSISNSNAMYNETTGKIIMRDTSNAYYGDKIIHGMGGLQYHNIEVSTINQPIFGYPIHRQSTSQINDTSMNNMFSVSKKLCYDFDVQYQRLVYNESSQIEPKREICINGYLKPKLIINHNSYTIFELTNVYTPVYPDPDLSLSYVEKFIDIGLHNAPLTREDISELISISNESTDITSVENINYSGYSSLIQLFNEEVFENNKYKFEIFYNDGNYSNRKKIVDISGIINSYSSDIVYPLYIGIDWNSITISDENITDTTSLKYISYSEKNAYTGSSIELSNNNTIIPMDIVINTSYYKPNGFSILYSIYIVDWNAARMSVMSGSYKINPNLTHNVFDTINNYVDGLVFYGDSMASRVMAMWGGTTLTSLLSSFPFKAYLGTRTYYYFDMSYTHDIYQLIYNPSRNELLQLTNEIKEIINDTGNGIDNIFDIFDTEYEIPEMSNYSKSNLLDLLILANNKKNFFTKNDNDDKYIDVSDVLFGKKIVNKYGNFDIYTFSEFEKQEDLYTKSDTNKHEHYSNMLGDTYIIGPVDLIKPDTTDILTVSGEKLDDVCIQISRKREVKYNDTELNDANMLYYISRDIHDISVNSIYSYEVKQFDKVYRFKLSDNKTYYDVYQAIPRITDISFIYDLSNDGIVTINDNNNVVYNNNTIFNIKTGISAIDINTNKDLYKRDLFRPIQQHHIVEFDRNEEENQDENHKLKYIVNYHKKIGSTNHSDFSINVFENELYLFQMLYNDEEKLKKVYEHAPILYPYKKNGDVQYYYDINYMPKIGDPFKTNRLFHARKFVQYGNQAIHDKYYLSTFRNSLDICYNGDPIDNITNEYHSDLSISGSYDYDVIISNDKLGLTKNHRIQRIPIEYISLQGSPITVIEFNDDLGLKKWLRTEYYTGGNYTVGTTITHVEIYVSSNINSEYDVSRNILGFVSISKYGDTYMEISRVSYITNNPFATDDDLISIINDISFNIESSYNRIEDINLLDPNMFIIRPDTSYNFTSISDEVISINGTNLNTERNGNTYSFHTPDDFSSDVLIRAGNNQYISDIILKSVNDDWKYTDPNDFSGCVINIKPNIDPVNRNIIVDKQDYESTSNKFIIRNSSTYIDDFDLSYNNEDV